MSFRERDCARHFRKNNNKTQTSESAQLNNHSSPKSSVLVSTFHSRSFCTLDLTWSATGLTATQCVRICCRRLHEFSALLGQTNWNPVFTLISATHQENVVAASRDRHVVNTCQKYFKLSLLFSSDSRCVQNSNYSMTHTHTHTHSSDCGCMIPDEKVSKSMGLLHNTVKQIQSCMAAEDSLFCNARTENLNWLSVDYSISKLESHVTNTHLLLWKNPNINYESRLNMFWL